MFDVIRSNVRVPEQVFGDLMANVTCNEVGGRQLLEFMDEYGLEDLGSLSEDDPGPERTAIRDRIAALPDGTYEGAIDIEGIDDPLRLACRAEIVGSEVSLDFAARPRPWTLGINVPLCYTRAFACYAVKCLTVPGMPTHEGCGGPDSGECAGGLHPECTAAVSDRRAARDRAHDRSPRLPHPR